MVMELNSELSVLLKEHFKWNKSRAIVITAVILAIIKLGTVNLTKLCLALPGTAKPDSKYRRIQRLFSEMSPAPEMTAKFIADRLGQIKNVICIDRTNWKFGTFNINILYLAVVCEGMAVPLLWTFLNKQGNSNTAERISLPEKYIGLFGADSIEAVMGDREFVGKKFFISV